MSGQQYSMRSPAVKRLMKEAQELHEPNELFHAQPLEDNLFEWHFTIRGPGDSEFAGGIYHGRIILPPDYPMKPPSVILLTPNGRFEVYKKICLSISGHHPESWQPSWSIRTALLAIIGFMPTHGNGAIGSLDYKPEERKKLAKKSADFKCPDCGAVKDLLLPETEASKAASEEAKELASQINMQGEKKGGSSESDAPAETSSDSKESGQPGPSTSASASTPSSQFNQFNPMMFSMPGSVPAPNTSSASGVQMPVPPFINPMFMRPPGAMPNAQQGFPQFPPGFPQLPSGFPQGFLPRFPTAPATSGSATTQVQFPFFANPMFSQAQMNQERGTGAGNVSTSTSSQAAVSSVSSSSAVPTSLPASSSAAAAAARPSPSLSSQSAQVNSNTSVTSSTPPVSTATSSSEAAAVPPSTPVSVPSSSVSSSNSQPRRRVPAASPQPQQPTASNRPTPTRHAHSNSNGTFALTILVAMAITILVLRRIYYMNLLNFSFSEAD